MKKEEKLFTHVTIDKDKLIENPTHNLQEHFRNTHKELSLQQSKRDQILTIYLAIFSFLVPFAISLSTIDWNVKGIIFIGVGIIGWLFSLIIVRYRIYKECYWLCCQTLTVLMNYKQEALNKELIQEVYYSCINKKGKKFIKKIVKKDGTTIKKFNNALFIKSNAFSSETIHFTIIAFIASAILGFGASLIFSLPTLYAVILGVGVGLLAFIIMHSEYFRELKRVYQVLVDDLDKSFNFAFSKAWLLHFYVKLDD